MKRHLLVKEVAEIVQCVEITETELFGDTFYEVTGTDATETAQKILDYLAPFLKDTPP